MVVGGKELTAISHSCSRFAILPRSKERERERKKEKEERRGERIKMEDATKVDFRSKLSSEQRKGNQCEKPKAKTKMNEENEISTLKAYTFDSRLAQATTERRSRDRRRVEGGDDEDE
ncbi:uncharacterized protein MONOS_13896 [Monocercomonoides exilis]|uniref:uncharacterized protein n=1 Tax=Monocercomonoides exilis TaxID=2049356 RepID=UPI00355AAB43|nr:hypothetical protein MONOS_13896 [Monocercomonoides exilis]|eukprot:MONOS_13896.1-p1 / transcript=MONOS_13896.1 / gene=MONOS_13896 / organism=Monocercomonoides_exilis_PA203 / gene_product=unspecified product / transcript_product=unspecified product / location=Mono_scaffold00901:7001-7354(+) / protein_length=118 / sequence_SO=supercontig / SO=protein_coding / is_pseudo=false